MGGEALRNEAEPRAAAGEEEAGKEEAEEEAEEKQEEEEEEQEGEEEEEEQEEQEEEQEEEEEKEEEEEEKGEEGDEEGGESEMAFVTVIEVGAAGGPEANIRARSLGSFGFTGGCPSSGSTGSPTFTQAKNTHW